MLTLVIFNPGQNGASVDAAMMFYFYVKGYVNTLYNNGKDLYVSRLL